MNSVKCKTENMAMRDYCLLWGCPGLVILTISLFPVFPTLLLSRKIGLFSNNLSLEICKFGCLALNLQDVFPQEA